MADFDESLFHVDGSLLLNPTLQYDLDLFGDVYRRRSMSYVGTFAEVFDKWYTRDEYVFMAIHVKKSEVDRVVAWLKEQDVVKEVPEI